MCGDCFSVAFLGTFGKLLSNFSGYSQQGMSFE